MELDNENVVEQTGEQSAENSLEQETQTGLEPKGGYGLRDGELYPIEDSEEEQPTEEEVPVETPVKTYKVKYGEEILEVPETELLNGYMRQTDFTRKTQELAQIREQLRREAEQSRQMGTQPQMQEPQSAEAPLTPIKVLEGLVSTAQQTAVNTLGLEDADEFDHWNPVHKAAYDLALNNLVNSFKEQEAKIQSVRNFESKLASAEPEYASIRQFATENLKYLPQYEYEKYQTGFAQGNVEIMNELYLKMKKAYNIYHGKETIEPPAPTQSVQERAKTVPPMIESGRGTAPQAEKPKRDYSALRGMTFDEQIKQLKDWGVKV